LPFRKESVGAKELISKVKAGVPGAVLESRPFGRNKEVSLWIEMGAISRLAEFLKQEPTLSLDWVENLSVMQVEDALVLTYFLRSSITGGFVIVRGSVVPESQESRVKIASTADTWNSVAVFEAEAAELFGIDFERSGARPAFTLGLLPETWKGFPLRKEYRFPDSHQGITHGRRQAALRVEPPEGSA
jgi:NADH:ubiquinone oxidoreductase subunit C